jgi:hypothetical protein
MSWLPAHHSRWCQTYIIRRRKDLPKYYSDHIHVSTVAVTHAVRNWAPTCIHWRNERLSFPSTYFYQKDEQALTGSLTAVIYLCPPHPPLNLVYLSTHRLSLSLTTPFAFKNRKLCLLSYSDDKLSHWQVADVLVIEPISLISLTRKIVIGLDRELLQSNWHYQTLRT